MIISYRFFRCTGHSRVFIFRNVQGWTEAGPGADAIRKPEFLFLPGSLEIFASQLSKRVGVLQRRPSVCRKGKQTRLNSSFTQTLVHL